jgi:hypothetical protein
MARRSFPTLGLMASRLANAQFDRLARAALREALGTHGFQCSLSKRSTFYREVSAGLFHVVRLDPLVRSPKYDVHIFPQSPVLEGDTWAQKFPDDLGIPTGSLSYLSSRTGVGLDQELYFCSSPEIFENDFNARVRPALARFGVPYLDKITSVRAISTLNGLHPVYAERLRAAGEV